jgi:hypothetical protein
VIEAPGRQACTPISRSRGRERCSVPCRSVCAALEEPEELEGVCVCVGWPAAAGCGGVQQLAQPPGQQVFMLLWCDRGVQLGCVIVSASAPVWTVEALCVEHAFATLATLQPSSSGCGHVCVSRSHASTWTGIAMWEHSVRRLYCTRTVVSGSWCGRWLFPLCTRPH